MILLKHPDGRTLTIPEDEIPEDSDRVPRFVISQDDVAVPVETYGDIKDARKRYDLFDEDGKIELIGGKMIASDPKNGPPTPHDRPTIGGPVGDEPSEGDQ